MQAYDSIKSTYKRLQICGNSQKLTIELLCKESHVSRKTFYTFFVNKEDVIAHIIRDEVMRPLFELQRILPTKEMSQARFLILSTLFRIIYNDRLFYESLIIHSKTCPIESILVREFCEMSTHTLSKEGIPDIEREYMAYFYSAALAKLVIRWVKNHMDLSPEDVATYFGNWVLDGWHKRVGANWIR